VLLILVDRHATQDRQMFQRLAPSA
jgi:hypothetical protein